MSKKSMIILTIVLVAVMAGIAILAYFPTGNRFSQKVAGEEQIENIKESRTEDEAFLAELIFDGQKLLFDGGTGTYYYSLDEDGKTSINPHVTLGGKDISLAVCKEITRESIEASEEIGMLLYTDSIYREVKLACTTLPLMNIEYSGYLEDGNCRMKMSLYDNRKDVNARITSSEGYIRYRGASTLFYPKKSLKLTLCDYSTGIEEKNYRSLLGMRVDEDWILYAGYNDQDRVRDVFSERLWWDGCADNNSWGVKAGMQYKYVEVLINGEYMGLYALGFPVDEKQFAMSGDSDHEALYKKKAWDSEQTIEMNAWGAFPGYECKTDNKLVAKGYTGEFGQWTGPKGDTVTDMSEWQLLYKYYYYLAENAKDSQKLMSVIDPDNAIDMYIFFNLIQGADNVNKNLIKNAFFAIKEYDNKLSALYAPWDMDITWGNKWVDNGDINFTVPYGITAYDNYVVENGYLEQILLNGDVNLYEKAGKRYFELRKGPWSDEAIDSIIDEYEDDIFNSGAYVRDVIKWPSSTMKDHTEKLELFRQYVHTRFYYADDYFRKIEGAYGLSTYVRRSYAYSDFKDNWYFVELNDHSYMSNPEFLDLLNYIEVDGSKITEDTKFIVGSIADGYHYYDTYPDEDSELGTPLGVFSLRRDEYGEYFYDDCYTLYLNDYRCYDVRLSDPDPVSVGIYEVKNLGHISRLNMAGDYEPNINTSSFVDESLKELAGEFAND